MGAIRIKKEDFTPGAVFYLKQRSGDREPVAIFVVDTRTTNEGFSGLFGDCYTPYGWSEGKDGKYNVPTDIQYLAHICAKWDSCTHWYFYGEDCTQATIDTGKADSYYHLCGESSFIEHIRAMCFVWTLCAIFHKYPDRENEYLKDFPITKDLINLMLKDFDIVKGEPIND